tara:strand:+ start:21075 stop:21206 length:132 start_codon:yes stop_codon:yes gene_type:complete
MARDLMGIYWKKSPQNASEGGMGLFLLKGTGGTLAQQGEFFSQ